MIKYGKHYYSPSARNRDDFDDQIDGASGRDYLYGLGGNDVLYGGYETDFLYGGTGNDVLGGGTGAFTDFLWGDAGNDVLAGGDGNDQIWGGADNDVLQGGRGQDLMTGGSGRDFFDYRTDPNSTSYRDSDIIYDFNTFEDSITMPWAGTSFNYREDWVERDGSAANTFGSAATAAYHIINQTGADYVFISDRVDGYLFADRNNDGGIDMMITLRGLDELSDFSRTDIVTPYTQLAETGWG